jgi:deoxyribonuclease-1
MRFLILALALWTSSASALQQDPNYYPTEFIEKIRTELVDETLKAELFRLLTSGHLTSAGSDKLVEQCETEECYSFGRSTYTQARRLLFGRLHSTLDSQGRLIAKDVYCESAIPVDKDDQLPDPALANTEHTWPQSRFSRNFPKETQKTDLHILFPVVAKANSLRSNFAFGDVVSELRSVCPQSRLGFSASGTSEKIFEPPSEHKGNAARAIFYFSVRYKMPVAAEQEASLKAWNRQDPVDESERQRNQAIFTYQRDRNPFVDYPQLIDRISDF